MSDLSNPQLILLLCLALPCIGGALVLSADKYPNLRESFTLLTGIALFVLVTQLIGPTMEGASDTLVLSQVAPGLSLALKLEPLGLLFALLASFLWIVTSIYAIGYMRGHGEKNQTRFYFWFAIAIAGVMGIAFAANAFSLFIFYEALTLATWPLVTHAGTDKAKAGGRVYLGILMGTSMTFFLFGIAAVWVITGTTDFRGGGILGAYNLDQSTLLILYALFVFGIGKAALMPFHRWLPAAMVAPTPVSALLHAVAVVKAGVFSVLKVTVYLFGLDTLSVSGASHWLIPIACLTILLASLTAMRRDNLKARLAYSTISQLAYIVLGALLANVWGVIAAALHMVMHAFGKITLFFCAGAIQVAAHKTEISDLRGLGKQMPFTFGFFLIGALTIIGLPPFGAMWSKWLLINASLALPNMDAQAWTIVGALLISTLLNIYYLLPISLRAFFPKQKDSNTKPYQEAPKACLIAMGLTSLGCIALFFFVDELLLLAQLIVKTP